MSGFGQGILIMRDALFIVTRNAQYARKRLRFSYSNFCPLSASVQIGPERYVPDARIASYISVKE
jgi:hypothetical protein